MKKDNYKRYLWIAVIIAYIAFVSYVLFKMCYLTVKSYDPSNNYSAIIRNITSIFTCLTASISLFLTVKFKLDSYKEKRVDKKCETDYYWFKALVADKFVERIFTFFNGCTSLVDELKKINETNVKANWQNSTYSKKIKDGIIQPFTQEYTTLQQELVLSTEIIDDKLAETIQAEFQNFQDKFLSFTDIKNPDYNQCRIIIACYQKKIISSLKIYNNQIYD